MVAVRSRFLSTPVGDLFAAAGDEGLYMLEFADRPSLAQEITDVEALSGVTIAPGDHANLDRIADELALYFAGGLREFASAPVLVGTPFQVEVWRELALIPYGATTS